MDKFWSRDKIKQAITKHDKNLTDCFNSFLVGDQNLIMYINSPSTLKIGTSYQLGVASDNKAAERRYGGHSEIHPAILSGYSVLLEHPLCGLTNRV